MTLNTYQDVQAFISGILDVNGQDTDATISVHRAFWVTLSYDDFVNGTVPNVTDPDTGQPIAILVRGRSAQSNLILALKGEGPLFDQATGSIGRMPANGPPWFTPAQIAELADWIDRDCPE